MVAQIVFNRHAVRAVKHEIQIRRLNAGDRRVQNWFGQSQQQQHKQRSSANAQRDPQTQRAAFLKRDVENDRQCEQSGDTQHQPEQPTALHPRRTQRYLDIVDRGNVVQSE